MTDAKSDAKGRERQAKALLTMAAMLPASKWTPENRVKAMESLIRVLGSGLAVASQHFDGAPEPYPGAVKDVVKHSLMCIEIAKKTGLIP